ncbi:hypothetical protein QBC41DRAFT_96524 [Cercophora samala]|uniref:Uncharacterized protein n=1 Tax=Cercophora samala TaxID=330535 RepID=A0AA39ZG73_9PEZI|nr:hypothetical protein QBC41DRAFT_96524 [Cercophora samala]
MNHTDDEQHYRPRIGAYVAGKFRVSDQVYVTSDDGRSLLGPYTVARVVEGSNPKKYELEHDDGRSVEGGREYDEDQLEFA